MTKMAEYKDTCPCCDEGIKVGDPIWRPEGDGYIPWRHVECPPPKLKAVCPNCFTEKAVDGSCLC